MNGEINDNNDITNARSLAPKTESVIDAFNKLDLSMMLVTETWLSKGPVKDQMLDTLENGYGIGGIYKDRGSRGGGVAILFRKSLMKMSEERRTRNGDRERQTS